MSEQQKKVIDTLHELELAIAQANRAVNKAWFLIDEDITLDGIVEGLTHLHYAIAAQAVEDKVFESIEAVCAAAKEVYGER